MVGAGARQAVRAKGREHMSYWEGRGDKLQEDLPLLQGEAERGLLT